MFPISRISKHSVVVSLPPENSLLWYCTPSDNSVSGRLYLFFCTDASGNILPFSRRSLSNEALSQSKVRDNNGWRHCFHSYSEGTVMVLPVIDSIAYSNLSISDMYVYSDYSNYSVAGNIIQAIGHKFTCLTQESFRASYSWDYRGETYSNTSAYSSGSTYTIEDHVVAPEGSYWYPRRGSIVTTYSIDPCGFDGTRLKHGEYRPLEMSKSVTNRLGTTISHETTSMLTYCLGSVGIVNDYQPSLPQSVSVSVEDPESFISDLVEKLPLAQANSYMNIAELRKFKELVPPVKALIRKKNLKSLADLYLWWKYSYNTTLGDLKSYYETFQKIQAHYNDCKQQTISLTYPYDGGFIRYNVLVDSFIEPIWNTFGFNIDLANAWDCIPFSFVVDWFVNIGSTLESIDDVSRIQNLKYSGVYRSFSRKTHLTVQIPNVVANITQHVYSRERLQSLPIDVVSLHLGNPTAHLLDGSSLAISNKKGHYHN